MNLSWTKLLSVLQSIRTPLLVSLALLFTLVLRLTLVDDYLGFGSDMGSYLITKNWVLGQDLSGDGATRPPLIGVLLAGATWLSGDPLTGAKGLALVASVLPAIGFYVLARRWTPGWAALVGAIFLIHHPNNSAITSWGFGSLLSFMLLMLALAWLYDITQGKRRYIPFVAAVVVLAGLNQTAAGLFGISAVTLILSSYSKRAGLALTFAVALSMIWLPFYLERVPLTGDLTVPGRAFLEVMPDPIPVGYMGAVLVLPVLLGLERYGVLWAIGLPIGLLTQFHSGDAALHVALTRADYVITIMGILVLTVALGRVASVRLRPHHYQPALLATAFAAALLAPLFHQPWSNGFHQANRDVAILTPDGLAAIRWVDANTSDNAALVTHPMGLAWYEMGLARRRSLGTWYAEPTRVHEGENQAFLCTMGWRQGCDPLELQGAYGIDYLLLDRSSRQQILGQPSDGWSITASLPWLEERFSQGEVRVYEVVSQ